MTSAETITPLADHAPKTYRRLNPRTLKRLTNDLIGLAGPEETAHDAKKLVVQYVADEIKSTDESIVGITPEVFLARLLSKAGVTDGSEHYPLTWTGIEVSTIRLDEELFVVDFNANQTLTLASAWPGKQC